MDMNLDLFLSFLRNSRVNANINIDLSCYNGDIYMVRYNIEQREYPYSYPPGYSEEYKINFDDKKEKTKIDLPEDLFIL